jgi:hypothetical protein
MRKFALVLRNYNAKVTFLMPFRMSQIQICSTGFVEQTQFPMRIPGFPLRQPALAEAAIEAN